MQLPQWMALFTRDVANHFWRLCAGWIPAHGILEHVGRRSGKPYRTPLMVFDADVDGRPGFAIMLTYGPNRDWLRNLTAAKSARMRRHGKTISVTNPHVVARAEAAQHVIKGWRPIIARVPFEQAVLLTKVG